MLRLQRSAQNPSKRVNQFIPFNQRFEARIGLNVTFTDWIKRHVCL